MAAAARGPHKRRADRLRAWAGAGAFSRDQGAARPRTTTARSSRRRPVSGSSERPGSSGELPDQIFRGPGPVWRFLVKGRQ
jgi:hypothetical protein